MAEARYATKASPKEVREFLESLSEYWFYNEIKEDVDEALELLKKGDLNGVELSITERVCTGSAVEYKEQIERYTIDEDGSWYYEEIYPEVDVCFSCYSEDCEDETFVYFRYW